MIIIILSTLGSFKDKVLYKNYIYLGNKCHDCIAGSLSPPNVVWTGRYLVERLSLLQGKAVYVNTLNALYHIILLHGLGILILCRKVTVINTGRYHFYY